MRSMADRCRLLAGSVGPEREPARPDSDDTGWFLPLHLRAPSAARERIVAQVGVGADVVVAPTWLTHRRALLPLGETRRAAEWSAAAVRLAREAVELGLERRAEDLAEAAVAEDDVRQDRPAPLVAAVLPALDDEPDVATGRLLPAESATARDYRDQAGYLADAEPDLILTEGQRSEADARIAIGEAVETGLPVWATLTRSALAARGTDGWLEWAGGVGVSRVLLPGSPSDHAASMDAPLPWGGIPRAPETVGSWLDAGAGAIALLDGASEPAVQRLRKAIDEHEQAAIAAEQADERRWWAMVERAAAMAPGGHAAWLGHAPARPLPAGFAWLVLDVGEATRLPTGRYRLVVTAVDTGPLDHTLEPGGLIVGSPSPASRLRLLVLDETAEPPLAIYRRED